MVASLRYLDVFAKVDGSWYFTARDLILDWMRHERSEIVEGSITLKMSMDLGLVTFARRRAYETLAS